VKGPPMDDNAAAAVEYAAESAIVVSEMELHGKSSVGVLLN
jgi:hypothetical protein